MKRPIFSLALAAILVTLPLELRFERFERFELSQAVERLELRFGFAEAAVGDTDKTCSNVAAGAVLDTVTSGAVRRVVTKITFEYDIEIQDFDNSTATAIDQLTGPPYIYDVPNYGFVVGSTNRIRLKNLHGSTAKRICYDWTEVK